MLALHSLQRGTLPSSNIHLMQFDADARKHSSVNGLHYMCCADACAVLPTTRHSTVQRHLSPEEQGLSLTNLTVNLPGRPNEALCQDLSLRLDPGVQMHRNRGVALVYSALSQDRSCKSSACTWTQ
eukprot:scaffold19968_cov14-Tisochrysis_lutea.AAC.1